jgi:Ca-activated chloride channel homolog
MRARILAFIILAVAAVGVVSAQIQVNVVQVPLLVTVSDNKGQLITGLTKENFRVFENQKAQKIDAFSRELDRPLSIALLVDTSSSVYKQLEFERSAAKDFFSEVVKPRKDRAAVIGFSNDAQLMTDFTYDQEQLGAGLKKLEAGGGSAVYDAVYKTVKQKLAGEAGDRRRLIILISDGYDNSSDYSLDEATEMAQKHDVVIFAISVNKMSNASGSEKKDGDKTIKHLVTETGGKAYFPEKLTELGVEFRKIEQELRSQYLLSYTPQGLFDGAFRKIRVELTDKKFKAHTRSGYYATR